MAGPAQPSVAQRTALQRLVQGLLNNGTLSGISNISHVFGHRHLPNQSTACPGMTRANVQAMISGGSTPAPPPAGNIQVGSTVRVNNNAATWATGQAIPAWVRGQTYVVQETRNSGNELLLANILSWIRRADVTLVSGGGGGTVNHTVRSGETLFSISQLHGTTVAVLQQLNSMGTSTIIHVGQALRLP